MKKKKNHDAHNLMTYAKRSFSFPFDNSTFHCSCQIDGRLEFAIQNQPGRDKSNQ